MQSWRNKAAERIITLRACAAHSCAAWLAALVYGCCSISVSHKFADDVGNAPLGGRYRLDGVAAPLAAALRDQAPKSVVFTEATDPSAVPLKIGIFENGEEKDATSVMQLLPGCFTLVMLPIFEDTHKDYIVRVQSPIGIDQVNFTQVQRDAMSSLPIGFLPCTYPLDGYECGLALGHDHGNFLNAEEKMDALAEGLTNAVAKAVLSTLTKVRYDAYMKDLAGKVWQKKMVHEANLRESILGRTEHGWPQEGALRDFAIRETTDLWNVIISVRAEISIRKARLQKLSCAIKGFGRKPEEDSDYIKCKEEYDAARVALSQIFKSLETAYLAASKNEALYESGEARTRTRKAVDECSRVAIDAQQRILKGK